MKKSVLYTMAFGVLVNANLALAKGGGFGNFMKSQYEAGFQAGLERGSNLAIVFGFVALIVGVCAGYYGRNK